MIVGFDKSFTGNIAKEEKISIKNIIKSQTCIDNNTNRIKLSDQGDYKMDEILVCLNEETVS